LRFVARGHGSHKKLSRHIKRCSVEISVITPSLNISGVAGCLQGGCLWAMGKLIWLFSRLLWMRAAGSLTGDSTAMFRLAAEA
jgi:hypothetical protein